MLRFASLRSLCGAALVLAVPADSQAPLRSTLLDLGAMGGLMIQGAGINASGQFAGR